MNVPLTAYSIYNTGLKNVYNKIMHCKFVMKCMYIMAIYYNHLLLR